MSEEQRPTRRIIVIGNGRESGAYNHMVRKLIDMGYVLDESSSLYPAFGEKLDGPQRGILAEIMAQPPVEIKAHQLTEDDIASMMVQDFKAKKEPFYLPFVKQRKRRR